MRVEELPVAPGGRCEKLSKSLWWDAKRSRTERAVMIPKRIEWPEMENKEIFVRLEGWCPAGLEELGLSGGLS